MLPPKPPALPPAAASHSWWRRRLIDPFVDLLRAGLSPERLAFAVALGVAFGLVPTFGITTLVSLAVGLRLRLNVAAMQLAAHLMSAFQLLLLIPLLRAGAWIMGEGHKVAHLSIGSLRHFIEHEGWGAAGRLLWRAQVGALLLWAAAAAPLVLMLYVGLRTVFRRVLARQVASPAA